MAGLTDMAYTKTKIQFTGESLRTTTNMERESRRGRTSTSKGGFSLMKKLKVL